MSVAYDADGKPLTQTAYMEILRQNFDAGLKLMKQKNADYAVADDPFRNFRGSALIGLTPAHAILLRMSDKLARIGNLLGKSAAEVPDETLEDSVLDIQNYSNILLTWLQTEGKRK